MTNNNHSDVPSDIIRNLLKSSIAKAQKSHLAYIEMNENMEFKSGTSTDAAFNQKALELAKNDAQENFKFSLKILDINDDEEAVKLHDEHSAAQKEEMAKRVAELQQMAKGEVRAPASASSSEPIEEKVDEKVDENKVETTAKSSTAFSSPSVATAALAAVSGAALARVETGEKSASQTPVVEQDNIDASQEDLSVEIVKAESDIADDKAMEAEIESLSSKIRDAKAGDSKGDVEVVPEVDASLSEIATIPESVEVPAAPEVVEALPEVAAAPEVVEALPEVAAVPEVVEALPEVAAVPEVVETLPEVAAAPAVVEALPEIPAIPEVVEALPEVAATPETSEEPKGDADSFDTDLSARLDAVRAMLQGSTS